jgi:hypothetical protein
MADRKLGGSVESPFRGRIDVREQPETSQNPADICDGGTFGAVA